MLVGVREFAELLDRHGGAGEGARLLEHKGAKQRVEGPEVLGRLRLVQQTQGVGVLDAHQATQAREERRMLARLGGDHRLHGGLELAHLDAARGEVLEVREGGRAAHDDARVFEAARIRRGPAHVEQLDQRDRVGLAVLVAQQHARPRRVRAQVRRDGAVLELVGLLAPRAAHVAHGRAVPTPGRGILRCSVERHPLGGRQHHGDRVEQRGLTRSRRARHEVSTT